MPSNKWEETLDTVLAEFSIARDYPALAYEESKNQAKLALTNAVREIVIGDIVRIGKERFENDSQYTFDAWLEDLENYQANLLKAIGE